MCSAYETLCNRITRKSCITLVVSCYSLIGAWFGISCTEVRDFIVLIWKSYNTIPEERLKKLWGHKDVSVWSIGKCHITSNCAVRSLLHITHSDEIRESKGHSEETPDAYCNLLEGEYKVGNDDRQQRQGKEEINHIDNIRLIPDRRKWPEKPYSICGTPIQKNM
jgi:hypothetical protein